MTDIPRLRAIEARLERATGPDRELDGEIMFSLFAKPVGVNGFLWPEDNPSWSFAIRFPGKDREWFKKYPDKETILIWRDGDPILMNDLRVPKLSASIDAADALRKRVLPDSFRRSGDTEPIEGKYFNAAVWDEFSSQCVDASTEPLAILLATIRALIAREEGR